ncbi:MAG: hypothetical protein ISQ57_00690 [Litoricola sp.]|jgi:hypothetical protein|nr:hypothetical protein [Litorivicinus sp.]
MSTLPAVRTSLTSMNPFATVIESTFVFVQGFFSSLRLAIEVSGEIDHTNRLTTRGYTLLGVKES